jgi:hypothetical protein
MQLFCPKDTKAPSKWTVDISFCSKRMARTPKLIAHVLERAAWVPKVYFVMYASTPGKKVANMLAQKN